MTEETVASEKLLAAIHLATKQAEFFPLRESKGQFSHDTFEKYRWLLDELKSVLPEVEFDWISPNYGWDFSISGEFKGKRVGVKAQEDGVSMFDGEERGVVLSGIIAVFRDKLL